MSGTKQVIDYQTIVLEKKRLLDRMQLIVDVVKDHCTPSVILLNSDEHNFQLGVLNRRLIQRKPQIENWLREIEHCEQLDDEPSKAAVIEKLRQVLYSIYFFEDPNWECIVDDLVDCLYLAKHDHLQHAKKVCSGIGFQICEELADFHRMVTRSVVIFDLLGSQKRYFPEVDIAARGVHRELRRLQTRYKLELQDLRPGDDEVVAILGDPSDAVEIVALCYREICPRLSSVIPNEVTFKCAIYTEQVRSVEKKPRGRAIIYASRLLEAARQHIASGEQFAVDLATYELLKQDPTSLTRLKTLVSIDEKEFEGTDKHEQPHKYVLGKILQ